MTNQVRFTRYAAPAAFCLLLLCTACGGDEQKKKEAEEASASVSGALNAVQEMARQAEESQKNGPVDIMDFRKLKELLPTDADGLPRKSAAGEKSGMAGFAFSTATGRYENADNTENIDLALVDAGGTGAMMGLAAWSMLEMDKETESGYEKTTLIGENKAYEKYDNERKTGEVAVLVNKRFVVTIKGRGVTMDKLKAVLDDIDLDKLGGK